MIKKTTFFTISKTEQQKFCYIVQNSFLLLVHVFLHCPFLLSLPSVRALQADLSLPATIKLTVVLRLPNQQIIIEFTLQLQLH